MLTVPVLYALVWSGIDQFTHTRQVIFQWSVPMKQIWIRVGKNNLNPWRRIIIETKWSRKNPASHCMEYTVMISEETTHRRVCSWGFKDLTPDSPDPVCYRTMEAATFEEAQRTCRGMFANMPTLPVPRYRILKEEDFGLVWQILCEVGLNQSKFMLRCELHAI